MLGITQRVAQRHLEAGLIEPPPKMVAAITKWVQQVAYATEAAQIDVEGQVRQEKEINDRLRSRAKKLRELIQELRALLENAGRSRETHRLYNELWETSLGMFGYTSLRQRKAKAFSKAVMGDREARKSLLDRINEELEDPMDRLRWQEKRLKDQNEHTLKIELEERKAELMRLAGKTKPFPNGKDELDKRFLLKLDGWKDGQKMLKKLREDMKASIREREEDLKKNNPDAYAFLKSQGIAGDKFVARKLKNIATEWKYINVKLKREKKKPASWQPYSRTITLYFKTPMHGSTRGWVEHELRHMAQSFLVSVAAVRKDVSDHLYEYVGKDGESRHDTGRLPGRPSKKILTPQYKQHDNPRKHRRYPMDENAPTKKQLHHLDDVEFYTDLADEIEDLKKSLADKEPDEKIKYFKYLVGMPNHGLDLPKQHSYGFFGTLKKFAEGKWHKAISEAYKAIFRNQEMS